MADLAGSPWWVVVGGALPSVVSGVWVFWRWQAERHDRVSDKLLTRDERLAKELDAERTALSRQQIEVFDRMRSEMLRYQARCTELERDRDRGWDLARWWHRRCHDLRHAGLNAQTMVEGLCTRGELPAPAWPDMTLPSFEDPKT